MKKLLIANRGEIAVRLIRAARELGIRCVVAHSQADVQSLAVQMADEAIEIGPPPAAQSYLNAAAILQAAQCCGADAIHPGYGFLSENAAFAQAVQDAGLMFVGPEAQTIALMGNKAAARQCAKEAGVPTVPGSAGVVASVEAAVAAAQVIGYPLLIKASAGGGGRGIRVAADEADLVREMPLAQREAQSAFGDGSVYLERLVRRARHIEVQVLGDGARVIHLYERECSLQRRRQKIMEEAPSPALSPSQRAALCESAVRLATQMHYRSAGTLEFLWDEERAEFYFMEMNTRIQVEHPVTECVTGIDLVRESLLIAQGQPLRYQQSEVSLRGAALECRINAEDPDKNFFPSLGQVTGLRWPAGPGVRVDSMLYEGLQVPPFYDSLLAKIIVWDGTRPEAIARMQRALAELRIEGVRTTAPLHQRLLADSVVQGAAFHTGFLEEWLAPAPPTVRSA